MSNVRLQRAGCKPMLDGVLKRRNDFFEIGRQLAATLDGWPGRDRRRSDDASAQRHRIKIVVILRSLACVWRSAQARFRWRTAHPINIPGGIDRNEHQRIV